MGTIWNEDESMNIMNDGNEAHDGKRCRCRLFGATRMFWDLPHPQVHSNRAIFCHSNMLAVSPKKILLEIYHSSLLFGAIILYKTYATANPLPFLDLSNQLISTSINLSSKKHTSHVESTFATVPGHLIRIVFPKIHQYRRGLLPLSHSCHGTDNTAVTHHITCNHSMIPWLLWNFPTTIKFNWMMGDVVSSTPPKKKNKDAYIYI